MRKKSLSSFSAPTTHSRVPHRRHCHGTSITDGQRLDFNPPSAQADGSLPSAYYGEAFQHLDGMVSSMIPGRGPTQDQAREIPVEVSLEELFAGATKKLTYKRQVPLLFLLQNGFPKC